MNRIWALIVMFAVSLAMGVSNVGRCYAEEPLYLGDNPRYPLLFALIWGRDDFRHYLDLDSCEVISRDEDGFEITTKYITTSKQSDEDHEYTCRFRKNGDSGWKLQVWDEHYDKAWETFIDPHDEDTIEQRLEEKGIVRFRLSDYYLFKCAYKYLFNETYEDGTDEDALQRSVMILPREEKPRPHAYLWNDKNYPRVWRSSYYAVHLDKNSVYVEAEASPQRILQVLTLDTVLLHYKDIFPNAIYFDRFLYDEDEGKMYCWSPSKEEWYYLRPNSPGRNVCIGEAAFYLAYGKKFYGETAEWSRRRTPYHWNENDTTFYERLDGMEEKDEIALRNQRILNCN